MNNETICRPYSGQLMAFLVLHGRANILIVICLSFVAGCSTKNNFNENFENVIDAVPLPKGWELASKGGNYRSSLSRDAREGEKALTIAGSNGSSQLLSPKVTIEAGRSIRCKIWVKPKLFTKGSTAKFVLLRAGNSEEPEIDSQVVLTDLQEWQELSVTYEPNEGDAKSTLQLSIQIDGEGFLSIDNIAQSTTQVGTMFDASIGEKQIEDGGFEKTKLGERPTGWYVVSEKGDGNALITKTKPHSGKQCLTLKGGGQWCVAGFGKIPSQGKIVVDAYARAKNGNARVKIEYMDQGKWVEDTKSKPMSKGTWQRIFVESEPTKLAKSDFVRVTIAAEHSGANGDMTIDFDDLNIISIKP